MIVRYDNYSNLFEKSYKVKSLDNRTEIKMEVRSRDHENLVHVHFSHKGKDYRYFVEGDYFMDHTSKPCKLDRDVAEAISAYCQNNKSEIVEQYMKGKGSHEKKEGNSMNKRTKKSKKDKNESLTVSSPSRIINVFYEKVPWIVKSVIPQTDYTLLLQFKDGKRGVYDMWPLIQQEDGGDDTFVPLEDINFFMKAHKDGDSVAWNDDIDIAPEELYANCMSISEYKHWSAEDEDEEERADGKS